MTRNRRLGSIAASTLVLLRAGLGAAAPVPAAPGRLPADAPLAASDVAGLVVRISRTRTSAAAAEPISVGSKSAGFAVGRVPAAIRPTAAKTQRPARPYGRRRTATAPITASNTPGTMSAPIRSATLSREPHERS